MTKEVKVDTIVTPEDPPKETKRAKVKEKTRPTLDVESREKAHQMKVRNENG